jgi:osmotically-inducible protein OsmY
MRRTLAPAVAVAVAMLAIAVPPLLTGCAPLVVGAAVTGTVLVATDRRSTGAQVDDEAIELKVANTVSERYGDKVHVNATSYNGWVLLCGEVPDPETFSSIGEIARTTNRVRKVFNELAVGPNTELSSRSNDTYITSKVKTRFLESKKFNATQVKVVTERGTVYLMGIVSHEEGDAAGDIASTTIGVLRVVKLFEYTN